MNPVTILLYDGNRRYIDKIEIYFSGRVLIGDIIDIDALRGVKVPEESAILDKEYDISEEVWPEFSTYGRVSSCIWGNPALVFGRIPEIRQTITVLPIDDNVVEYGEETGS